MDRSIQNNHQPHQLFLKPDPSPRLDQSVWEPLFEQLGVGAAVLDSFGKLVRANLACCQMLGYSEAELRKLSLADLLHPADRSNGLNFWSEAQICGEDCSLKVRYLRQDGSEGWANITLSPLQSDPVQDWVLTLQEDISCQHQWSALRAAPPPDELANCRYHDLLEAMFQESADAIFLVDSVSLLTLNCNQRAVELFEADSIADLIGIEGYSLHRYPVSAAEKEAATRSIEQWHTWNAEIEYRTFKGRFFWGSFASKLIQLADERLKLVRVMDISERKRTDLLLQRQSERDSLLRQVAFQTRESVDLNYILSSSAKQVQQFLQADRVVIYQFKPDGSGQIAVEAVSHPQFAILGQRFHDPCFNLSAAERYQQRQISAISDITDGSLADCYMQFLSQLQVRAALTLPILESQQLWGLLIAHHASPRQWESYELELLSQLTDQMGVAIWQTDLYAQVKSQLRQKEILLKEVHHRVKNNLQVISSMLRLQARTTQDATALALLEDSRSRLQAIALIHEVLYQSDNLEQLDFAQYVERLAKTILATHSAQSLNLVCQLQPVLLNIETAIPCGLLLNELITNAIKHAFPDQRSGEIQIKIESINSSDMATGSALATAVPSNTPLSHLNLPQYKLTVRDNGIGIPANLNLSQLNSLGLKIVYDLALQLRGDLTFKCERGTCFQLVFSELQYRRRL